MSTSPSISAVVVTYNDAYQIGPCLDSVRWADEIVIMDLGSTDDTIALCRNYTNQIHVHPWSPYVEPVRNAAIERAHGRWILVMDPDERASEGLGDELRRIVARDDADVVLIPWWLMIFGQRRVDRLALADRLPRFFRSGSLRWPDAIHARPDTTCLRRVELDANSGHYLLHDSWRTLDEVIDKTSRYTEREARLLHERGISFSIGRMLLESTREVGRAIVYQTYRNGTAGLMATSLSVFYRWMVWARMWEFEGHSASGDRAVKRWGSIIGAVPGYLFDLYHRLRRSHLSMNR